MQMERAFVNVLENARRHSGGHPVSVRARAVRSLARARRPRRAARRRRRRARRGRDRAGDRVIVRIVDRGPGIPPAQLERVFEPFYRAGTAGSGHRGSGLGLAIARGFTEANAGSLHVESLPGQGATFVFELPLQAPGGESADGAPSTGTVAGEQRAPVAPATVESRLRERRASEPRRPVRRACSWSTTSRRSCAR